MPAPRDFRRPTVEWVAREREPESAIANDPLPEREHLSRLALRLAPGADPLCVSIPRRWHNKWLALRPDIVIAHVLKIPRDHVILLGACAGITFAQWLIESQAWMVPIFSGATGIVSAYLGLIEAHIIGWTLYMNHEELGWD